MTRVTPQTVKALSTIVKAFYGLPDEAVIDINIRIENPVSHIEHADSLTLYAKLKPTDPTHVHNAHEFAANDYHSAFRTFTVRSPGTSRDGVVVFGDMPIPQPHDHADSSHVSTTPTQEVLTDA